MALGWIAAAAGAGVVGWALRDMARQIHEIQSRSEAQMRMETAAKPAPKPKS
jgi:hypothetical protein